MLSTGSQSSNRRLGLREVWLSSTSCSTGKTWTTTTCRASGGSGSDSRGSCVLSSAMTVPVDLPVDVVIGHVLPARPGGAEAIPDPRRARLRPGVRGVPERAKPALRGTRRDPPRLRGLRRFERHPRACGVSWTPLRSGTFRERWTCCCRRSTGGSRPALGRRNSPYRLRIHSNVAFRGSAAPARRTSRSGRTGTSRSSRCASGFPSLPSPSRTFSWPTQSDWKRRACSCVSAGTPRLRGFRGRSRRLKSLTPKKRQALSRRGRRSVDGRGIERIRRVIEREALRAQSA